MQIPPEIAQLSPYAAKSADNPVFRWEIRHLSWAASADSLKNFSIRLISRILYPAVSIAVVVSLIGLVADRQRYMNVIGSREVIWALLAVNILPGIWLDYMSLSVSIGSISGEFRR